LNKKYLGIVLFFAFIMIIAATSPALAHNNHQDPPVADSMKSYGSSSYVVLQLPSPSAPSHPYNLRLGARHFTEGSVNGEEDYLGIYVWSANYPGGSRFVWIGGISDSQAGLDFVKVIYTGYVGAVNHIKVEDSELEVTKKGDVLTVNLTKSVTFNIGDPWAQHLKDLNFTLPAMTLVFRGFDEIYKVDDAATKIVPPASGAGWTVQQTFWREPAWVEVSIPGWYGNTLMHADGYFNTKFVETWTPPTT